MKNSILLLTLLVANISYVHADPTPLQQEMITEIETEVNAWCDSLDAGMVDQAVQKPTSYTDKANCKSTIAKLTSLVVACTPVQGATGNSEAGSEACRQQISETISGEPYGMVLWAGMKAKEVAMRTHLDTKGQYQCLEMLFLGRVMDHLTNDVPVGVTKGETYRILPLWAAPPEKIGIVQTMWSVLSAKFAGSADPTKMVLAGQSAPRLNSFLWTDEVSELIQAENAILISLEWWSGMVAPSGKSYCEIEKEDRISKGISADGMNCALSCSDFVKQYDCGKGAHTFGISPGNKMQQISMLGSATSTSMDMHLKKTVASTAGVIQKSDSGTLEPADGYDAAMAARQRGRTRRNDARAVPVSFQSAIFYCRVPEDSPAWIQNIAHRTRTPTGCPETEEGAPPAQPGCEDPAYVCHSQVS